MLTIAKFTFVLDMNCVVTI